MNELFRLGQKEAPSRLHIVHVEPLSLKFTLQDLSYQYGSNFPPEIPRLINNSISEGEMKGITDYVLMAWDNRCSPPWISVDDNNMTTVGIFLRDVVASVRKRLNDGYTIIDVGDTLNRIQNLSSHPAILRRKMKIEFGDRFEYPLGHREAFAVDTSSISKILFK